MIFEDMKCSHRLFVESVDVRRMKLKVKLCYLSMC